MTATAQTSFLSISNNTKRMIEKRHRNKLYNEEVLYQIEITDFEGEIQYLEVMAHDVAEAAEIAQSICNCDIYMINIYEHWS